MQPYSKMRALIPTSEMPHQSSRHRIGRKEENAQGWWNAMLGGEAMLDGKRSQTCCLCSFIFKIALMINFKSEPMKV